MKANRKDKLLFAEGLGYWECNMAKTWLSVCNKDHGDHTAKKS